MHFYLSPTFLLLLNCCCYCYCYFFLACSIWCHLVGEKEEEKLVKYTCYNLAFRWPVYCVQWNSFFHFGCFIYLRLSCVPFFASSSSSSSSSCHTVLFSFLLNWFSFSSSFYASKLCLSVWGAHSFSLSLSLGNQRMLRSIRSNGLGGCETLSSVQAAQILSLRVEERERNDFFSSPLRFFSWFHWRRRRRKSYHQ